MSPRALGMLSDAGEGAEWEAVQKMCFLKGTWVRMLLALLSSGTRAGGFCCRGLEAAPCPWVLATSLLSRSSSHPCAG